MNRREFLARSGVFGLGLAVLSGCASAAQRQGPWPTAQPDLLLADQLRYQSCGFAGDAKAHTPNLDRLAGRASSSATPSRHPVCAAYRASLFTGKYTTSTGMVINELRMNTNHVFLAQVLTRHGYDTGYIGKWHLWANELGNHYDPKNSFTPPGPYRFGFDGFWAAYNFHHEYYDGYYHTDSPEKIPARAMSRTSRPTWPSAGSNAPRAPASRSPCSCPSARRTTRGTRNNVPAQVLRHVRRRGASPASRCRRTTSRTTIPTRTTGAASKARASASGSPAGARLLRHDRQPGLERRPAAAGD